MLARRAIDRAFLPPVALLQMCESAPDDLSQLGNLEYIVVAGEQLRINQSVRRFFRGTRARLVNQYGPTETHVATEETLDAGPLRWPELPSIGRPIAGVQVSVWGPNDEPSPLLVPGEIVISGVAPALGYIGDVFPDGFLQDPIGSEGRLAYRTGDRARWHEDGSLQFLGRLDDQVKIRGYRVELGDLEANAIQLPGVSGAAARNWTDGRWHGLALYLVVHHEAPPLRELRELLRRRVPEYMLPALNGFVAVSSLPLTATGKVDRASLPQPDGAVAATVANSVATLEGRIATVWANHLGLSAIQASDNFIDLGGHSLMAIRIVSEINDAFSVAVPLSTLLRGITLDAFVDVVRRLIDSHDATSPSNSPSEALDQLAATIEEIELPIGTIATPAPHETRHLWNEIFPQSAYDHPRFELRDKPTIVDVGAIVGLFSRYAISRYNAARLLAIEPATMLFTCLARNVRSEVATLLNLGCGAENRAEDAFCYFPRVPAMSSFVPDTTGDLALLASLLTDGSAKGIGSDQDLVAAFERVEERPPRRRLSSIVRDHSLGAIDLLKIDVQRGEMAVLEGINAEDWGLIRYVVVELQDEANRLTATTDKLRAAAFEIDVRAIPLHSGTNIRFVYGWRK